MCVLYLDTGTIRRIGPNRVWVEAARRWGARGVTSVRFDMDGMGDSDGDASPYRDLSKLYDPWIVDQVTSVMDQLQSSGRARRFVIVGLSAGAYWALHAAQRDSRVSAIALINPGALVWDPGQSPLSDFRTMRHLVKTGTISLATLRKALGPRGLALAVWLVRGLVASLSPGRSAPRLVIRRADEMRGAIAGLRAMKARRLLVFCVDEPVLAEIKQLGLLAELVATPGVTYVQIPTNDHTLRPPWAQRDLHAALDRLIAAESGGVT